MHILLRSLPLLWTTVDLLAQAAAIPSEPPPPTFVDRPFDGLFVDTPREDGTIWARGAAYKAGFAAAGVTYVPFFGPKNPTMPLQFRLGGVTVGGEPVALQTGAAPRSEGSRITFDRGALVEQWDLQPQVAQQSFVLAKPPGAGHLVLEIEVTSKLRSAERDADGLVFAAPGLGSVHYSDAVVVDADGRRTPLPVTAREGGIRIAVPATLLAAAAFPLVIDPLVTTRSFDASATDSVSPDLCYDVTNDVWLLVNRDIVASNDADIRCRRLRPDGTLLSSTFAESSTDQVGAPSVANSRRHARFLVGWTQVVSIISEQALVREHSSTSAGQSSEVIIDATVQGFGDLDIGGSTDATGLFLVTWTPVQVIVAVFRSDVACRTYAVGGVLGATAVLASQIGCGANVAVSRTAGPGERWAVVWTEDSAAGCVGGNIACAVLASHGAVVQSRVPLDTTILNDDSFPDVAGDGTTFLATWQRGLTAPRDIMGAVIGPGGAGFAKLSATLNLTQLEPGAPLASDQRGAQIEWDGCRFAYGYFEGATPRPFLATLALDGITPIYYEGHLACSTAASTVSFSSIAIGSEGSSGGDPGICQAVWQQIGNGGRDLLGVVFDLRATTGGVTRVLTHCPNHVASAFTTIDAVGTPALGRTFSIELGNAAGLPFVIAGVSLPTPLTLCATTLGSCRQGVQLPAMVTQFGASLVVAVPCDIGLVGLPLAFQGIDVGAGGGCGNALFGVAFRVTDTLVVRLM